MKHIAGMKAIDARTIHPEAQYELRKQVIRLCQEGMSRKAVAKITGMSKKHISTLWQAYQRNGMDAIWPKVRGRRFGQKRRLTAEQETAIKQLLKDNTPDRLNLPFALWTREAVRQVIKQRYGIDLPLRTITEYLKRWDFTSQKPIKIAYEQNPDNIEQWLTTDYPAISLRARIEGADIFWGDETGISCNYYTARGFAPRGKPPVIRINAKKMHLSMISAITNFGAIRFMLYRQAMAAPLLIKFMTRLVKDAPRKIFLILDNLSAHHDKRVKTWLENHPEQIEVFYLPSYAPEYNPDEYLNSNLKQRMGSGLPSRSMNDLTKGTRSFMKTLQKRPLHVSNFFKHPKVAYAA